MYLYGASGHARVIIDILNASGITVDGMFDDDCSINSLMSIPVKHEWNGESPIVVSIGNNVTRKQITEKLNSLHPEYWCLDRPRVYGGRLCTRLSSGYIVWKRTHW